METKKVGKKEEKIFYLGYGVSLKAHERPRPTEQFDNAIRTFSEEFHREMARASEKYPRQHGYPGF